ncbi:MAG: protein kinase domain-containing protein [Anaerolineales bacterium]
MPPSTDLGFAGQRIKGYELREMIGQGGFGAVYRAHQAVIEREVAIKIILPKYASRPAFIRRFEAEAQVVARLEHLHIVPLYDFWRDPDGAFLVMRLFTGGTLRQAINRETWDIKAVLKVARQVSAALMTAHQNNIVHRDIKPANILMDAEGNAYLSDFGIAKVLNLSEDPENTDADMLSPMYVAPEQIHDRNATPASDQYSFGILLWEMLAGSHPYAHRATAVSLLRAHLYDPLPRLADAQPGLPPELDDVLQRACDKDPDARFADLAALEGALRRALRAETRPIHLDGIFNPMESRTETKPIFAELDGEIEPIEALLAPDNPFQGLQPFTQAASRFFFGRESLITSLVDHLRTDDKRFLAVVGPSGSGKSSLVRAGLLPALREGALPGSADWYYVDMVPGYHPLEELEAALLSIATDPPPSLLAQLKDGTRGLIRAIKRILPRDDQTTELVLVIDQFEEVFTLAASPVEQALFMEALYQAVKDPRARLRVIITLRADFYDQPLRHPSFGQLIRDNTQAIAPMTPEELERAIVAPLGAVGISISPALVTAIITDIQRAPSALPLLQYALTELFDARDGERITRENYQHIGGVLGALAGRAERLYNELGEEGQALARQLFLRLVTLGSGTHDTRRRARLDELLALGENRLLVQSVIDLFGEARLLTFDHDPSTRQATVELGHEALIQNWERLRGWLDDSREDIQQQRRLAGLVAEWEAARQEPSFLLRGARLEDFARWAAATPITITEAERAFLDASLAHRQAERATEAERAAREAALEQRARRRAQILLAVMTLAAMIGLALALFAFSQRETAQAERAVAEAERATSDANAALAATQQAGAEAARATSDANARIAEERAAEVRALSLVDNAIQARANGEPELALAIALEAAAAPDPPPQVGRLLNELANAPGTHYVLRTDDPTIWSLALAPASDYLLSAGGTLPRPQGEPAFALRLWDTASGTQRQIIDSASETGGHTQVAVALAAHPTRAEVLSASFDGTFRVWNAQTGALLRVLDMENGEQLLRLNPRPDGTSALSNAVDGALAISPAGDTFLSAAVDGILRLRRYDDGHILRRMEGHEGSIGSVAYVGPGAALTRGADNTMILWDLESGEATRRYTARTGAIDTLAVHPAGEMVLYGAPDGTLAYAALADGEIQYVLRGHSAPPTALALHPRGDLALSGASNGEIILWDVRLGQEINRFAGHEIAITDIIFGPAGRLAYSADFDGVIRAWDVLGGYQELRRADVPGAAFGVAVSPDGQTLATGTGNRLADGPNFLTDIILYNAEDGAEVGRLRGPEDEITTVVFSPDGATLAATSRDGGLYVYDVASEALIFAQEDHDAAFYRVAFAPDGARLITGGYENAARVWSLPDGELVTTLAGHAAPVLAVAYAPGGDQIATGDFNGQIILWDAATGEEQARLSGHTEPVSSLQYSADGARLLSASFDTHLIIWDVAAGAELERFSEHQGEVLRAVFSPDGARVLSAGLGDDALLWSVASGEVLHRFRLGLNGAQDVAFGPDGGRVYLTTGALHTWALPAERSVAAAREWLVANRYIPTLSCAEQLDYLFVTTCTEQR